MEPKAKKFRQASILYSLKSKTSMPKATVDTSESIGSGKGDDDSVPETSQAKPVFPTILDANDPAFFVGKTLTDDEKFSLLTSELSLPKDFKFETSGGRRFQESWAKERPWLRYSVSGKSAFCLPCICFGTYDHSSKTLSPFVSKGFCNWKKAVGKKDGYLDQHMQSDAHKNAEMTARPFLDARKPGRDIHSLLSKQAKEDQKRSKQGLLSIIDIVITLGMRGIALRGNWHKEDNEEDGNFTYFVKWKASFDRNLEDHLQHASRNAKFTSPRIQNEIVNICEDIIRQRIVSSIPQYWSVMADETTDVSAMEQMSICVRYVNREKEVCEEFLGFKHITKMDASAMYDALISSLLEWGLDLSNLVGQAYDGASTMSGKNNGLQKRVLDNYPKAIYVHCRSHILNLAIAGACTNVPSIRNLFDNVRKITSFLGDGAKRKEIFKETLREREGRGHDDEEMLDLIIGTDEVDEDDNFVAGVKAGARKKLVPKLCPTRWSSRVETLSALLAKYTDVLETLSIIAEDSNGEPRMNSQAFIRLLEDPEFIVSLIVCQHILIYTAPVTKNLQAKDCDLGEAYNDVKRTKECISEERTEERWDLVWSRIERIAGHINVEMRKPRTSRFQRHRANAGHSAEQTNSEYYRINVYYPFIDHVVEELEMRFHTSHEGLLAAQCLVPAYLNNLTSEKIDSMKDYYRQFLSFTEMNGLDAELTRWKHKYVSHGPQDLPKTASLALRDCCDRFFPAISKIMTIFVTVPVGSVCCERSFSGLRRLKLWTRASMSEDRLSGLAMLMIHRGTGFIPSSEDVYEKKATWRA